MKKALTFTMLLLGLCGFFSGLCAQATPDTTPSLNKMPLAFTKNIGQWDEQVLYRADAGGATMWFTREGVTYQFIRRIDNNGADQVTVMDSRLPGQDMEQDSVEQLVITAKFVGANPNPRVEGEGLMEYKCNYFIGNDPARWHTDVPNYEGFTLKTVYTGIDIRFSGNSNGQATYEFVVAPGTDLAPIKVEYEGAEETSLDSDGRLTLRTQWGDMIAGIESPTIGVFSGITSFSWIPEKTIGFEVDGASRQVLRSSAVGLSYSTYLGGGNQDAGLGMAVDGSGGAFVTGSTYSSDFPTQSAYDTSLSITDMFVAKLSPLGNSLIYSTYLGGSGDDVGTAIAVDASGCAYVTGETYSYDFPVQNAYDASFHGPTDAFVTKVSSFGNILHYSTYLGGSSRDCGRGIAIDDFGRAHVTGETFSIDFPTQNAYAASYNLHADCFLTKFSAEGNSFIYSTYFGGSGGDFPTGIAIDTFDCTYITGYSDSPDLPTLNAYDASYNGGAGDVIVTKFSAAGDSLLYSSYLGGSDFDCGLDIAVDASGCAYLTGSTTSIDFPTKNAFDVGINGQISAFVTKLSQWGNMLVYSTYLGGLGDDESIGIAVDASGCAYVTGYTSSSDFPVQNAYDSSYNENDAFVTKFTATGNALVYSTFLGGYAYFDYGYDIAVDGTGSAFVTGITWCFDFPTLNAFDASFNGGERDAFVTKLDSGPYTCGDSDGSSIVSISDVVYLISYIFSGGPAPSPLQSGDADCSSIVTISDAVYLINYIFSGGAVPCAACA